MKKALPSILAVICAIPLIALTEACFFDRISIANGGLAIAIPVGRTCAPQGHECRFNNDCCSRNCVKDPRLGRICKPKGKKTCTPEGRACKFASDCCSKRCDNVHNKGKMCRPKNADRQCVPEGRSCRFDSDCCTKECSRARDGGHLCVPKKESGC